MRKKTIILIPTINEEENLRILLKKIPKSFDILVLDYKSKDNTLSTAKQMGVKTLSVTKKGLGKAYVQGFNYSIKNDYDILIEMDADLSHDPKKLLKLITPIQKRKADMVIGSRYVKDGKILGWNPKRYLISYFGNMFARITLRTKIKDLTSGYRAIRVNSIKKIELNTLGVSGYAFQISLINELLKNKSKIIEIPITFTDRVHGKSKLGHKDITEFLKYCMKNLF